MGQPDALPGIGMPQAKIGHAGFWISYVGDTFFAESGNDIGNSFWIVNDVSSLTDFTLSCCYRGILTPYESYAIDVKMDDGLPNSGKVLPSFPGYPTSNAELQTIKNPAGYIMNGTPVMYGPKGATSNFCVANNVTPPIYNTENTSKNPGTLCILQIVAGF
jgi:hypothetical protein